MRRVTSHPVVGDRRTVRGFLWFPRTVSIRSNSDRMESECRWLEFAEYEETYRAGKGGSHWYPSRWVSA